MVTPSQIAQMRFDVGVAGVRIYDPAKHVLMVVHPVLVVPWHGVLMYALELHVVQDTQTLLRPYVPSGQLDEHVLDGVRYRFPLHLRQDEDVVPLHSAQEVSQGVQTPRAFGKNLEPQVFVHVP